MAHYPNITNPMGTGYQVRVVRKGKLYEKYFAYREFDGNAIRALSAATKWRDQIKAKHRVMGERPVRSNTGHRGISRVEQFNKRRGITYVVFTVYYPRSRHRWTNKIFFVGDIGLITERDEQRILKKAIAFRRAAIKNHKKN